MDDWKTKLRNARVEKGYNKTTFAKLVGVSNPTVTDWEKSSSDGGIAEISGANLMKVCKVLDLDARTFYALGGMKSDEEREVEELVSIYRSLEPRDRATALTIIRSLAGSGGPAPG